MLHSISSKQFTEWMAFASVEPIGDLREDLRNASLMALIANANRNGKGKTYKPKDFIIDFWKSSVEQSVSEQLSMAETMTSLLGGKDLRNNG